MTVLLDPAGGVVSYGRTKRLVPPAMRLALAGRDRGCTFPGCDRPPGWTEAHHLIAWADGGPPRSRTAPWSAATTTATSPNAAGRSVMRNGRPHWIPPAWLDPAQVPRMNQVHDPPIRE